MVHTLLLLPADPARTPLPLTLSDDGRILARGRQAGDDAVRCVLAVPGENCRILRLRLPARSALQARAAARMVLREQLADDPDRLHVAVGAADADGRRWIVAVSPERLREWLERAGAAGFQVQAVVPAPLLLGSPGGDDVRVADHGGMRLACGEALCFAAEPELAGQLLAGRAVERVDDVEAALARGAVAPAIDLLQEAFATATKRPEGWSAWRRAAILAAILLLSPLLLLAATVARDRLAAHRAQSQAAELARTVLPVLPVSADPAMAVRAELDAMRSPERFAHATGALFGAVSGIAGAELDALSWSEGTLDATVALPGSGDMERLRTRLAEDGLELIEHGGSAAGPGHYRIRLRPLP